MTDALAFYPNHSMLTGETAPRLTETYTGDGLPASFDVPSDKVRKALIHEVAHPALNPADDKCPTSNSAEFDRLVQPYLTTKRWARAYRFGFTTMIDPEDALVYAGGRMIFESSSFYAPPYQDKERRWAYMRKSLPFATKTIKRGILLHSPRSYNYYHLMHDCMTRIALAADLGIPRDVPLIATKNWAASEIGQQFLQSTLFDDRELVLQPDDQFLRCRELYVIQPQRNCRQLLQKVADSFPTKRPEGPVSDKLVVRREKDLVHLRKNTDIDTLAERLENKGYLTIDPATFTIPEQKWMFANATHVVAENGASLTNMIFCDPKKTKIDSLMVSKYATPTFQALASALGIKLHANILPSTNVDAEIHATIPPDIMDHLEGLNLS